MDVQAALQAVYAWAKGVAGDDVVTYWANPNAPRPPSPALSLNLIVPPTMVGMDELRDVEGDPDAFRIVGPRTALLSVIAYGESCIQLISDLQTSISDPSAMTGLQAAKVSILSTSPPRDATVQLETVRDPRTQIDVRLLLMEDKLVTPGVIETVEIESTAGDQSDAIEG